MVDPSLIGMLGPRIQKLVAAGKLTVDIGEGQIIFGTEGCPDGDISLAFSRTVNRTSQIF
jgi:hypothetical protein